LFFRYCVAVGLASKVLPFTKSGCHLRQVACLRVNAAQAFGSLGENGTANAECGFNHGRGVRCSQSRTPRSRVFWGRG